MINRKIKVKWTTHNNTPYYLLQSAHTHTHNCPYIASNVAQQIELD